ncbi:DEAD/DEAH box helicase family protein [uncultured Salegentibacter sp.]|uniref:DEAD/DEAH box helicase n=1 Tax=uncultured Salegentibacter sp. TaxID=259320 RepID=UPI002597803A|nr:DEAD/DEAH box helicase family protein [uncultured Salegentibacter sp.]
MSTQQTLHLDYEVHFTINEPVFYEKRRTKIGLLTQLACNENENNIELKAIQEDNGWFNILHDDFNFKAKLIRKRIQNKDTFKIDGCVENVQGRYKEFYDKVKLNGIGKDGLALRSAQIGSIYALLSYWSINTEAATIVLPTGTGKTETMLVTTLADRAERTLVIVPSIDLKIQIANKFGSWGILRKLGVIPKDFINPKVLILNKTLHELKDIQDIENADVIVTTPALIARAPIKIRKKLKEIISHVFFDEAHHIKATEWNSLKTLFNASKIVQFTATPYRNDRKPIEGEIIYNYPLSKAIEDNCFSKISLVTVDEIHPKKKDRAIADAAMNRLYDDRRKGWTEHCMMVRAKSEAEAERLFKDYKKWYPKERIVLIHSKVKEKNRIVQKIKNRAFDIIVCVNMLKEGFDFPEFKIAAVHGIHKSLAVLLQFIGRFTRPKRGLGDASFVVNYAEEKMSIELENLFQEGSGWEYVISEVADAKKTEAESLLKFLQGCQPFSGFDSPDIDLNPKLVYPALSCVCYECDKVNWKNFKNAFNLKKYSLSQPFINNSENIFYFTTQKRDKVKWARTNAMRDQFWDLIVMHHDPESKMLYVGYSEKRLDTDLLVEKISNKKSSIINGDCVFRSFDAIKRLNIVHAGIFKPANQLHRYSRLSGADVTTELNRWKENKRCKKSDFVGVGYRNGFPVSIGASVKGKIWSPARVGNLKEWKAWCLNIGKLITDSSINANQLLEDSASKIQLTKFPDDIIVLATDWAEELYERIHKITIESENSPSFLLSECSIINNSYDNNKANFTLKLMTAEIYFSIKLGGEDGFVVEGLDKCKFYIDGLKKESLPLKRFFEENPPTLFLLNGSTISGSVHTKYNEEIIYSIPEKQIESLRWENVNFTIESMYKGDLRRENSIQEFMMKMLKKRGATIVFNDDNSGEKADIIAIFIEEDHVHFEMIHCKYSKAKSGARKSDLYEVCGQAIISLHYKWKPEELLKHMERRNSKGVLKNKRFFHGSLEKINTVRKALKYSNVSFEFAIAQPGVKTSSISKDMENFLGSVYSTIVEMTETELKCYFTK